MSQVYTFFWRFFSLFPFGASFFFFHLALLFSFSFWRHFEYFKRDRSLISNLHLWTERKRDEDALGEDHEVAVVVIEVDAMLVGGAIRTLTTPMGHRLDTQQGKNMAEEDMEVITMIVPMVDREVALVIIMALTMDHVIETMVDEDHLLLLTIAVDVLIIRPIDPDLDPLVSITTSEDQMLVLLPVY